MSEEIKLKNDREEQDSPWKELIEKFLPEFMKFFFPKAYNKVDWTRPHEFLEQELYQIHPEGETGKRIADKLVKVWTKKGKEKWWLIH
ncbi:MAG: transposase, partial [Blastocatellia bacterium]|nr:transposase [Blastocatellia bacterium]